MLKLHISNNGSSASIPWICLAHRREEPDITLSSSLRTPEVWIGRWFESLWPGGFQHKSWRLHHDEVILAVAQEERDSPGSEGSSDVHLHPLVLHYVYPLALGLKQPIIGCFTHSISQHIHCRSGHKSLGLSGTVWCSTPQSADLGVRAPLCYTLLLCGPQWWIRSASGIWWFWCHVIVMSLLCYACYGHSQHHTTCPSSHIFPYLPASRCQIIALQGHDATNRTRLIAFGPRRWWRDLSYTLENGFVKDATFRKQYT
jgi:hypothetical protein